MASVELAKARAVVDLVYCASIDGTGATLSTLDADTIGFVMSGLIERIDRAKDLVDKASELDGPVAA